MNGNSSIVVCSHSPAVLDVAPAWPFATPTPIPCKNPSQCTYDWCSDAFWVLTWPSTPVTCDTAGVRWAGRRTNACHCPPSRVTREASRAIDACHEAEGLHKAVEQQVPEESVMSPGVELGWFSYTGAISTGTQNIERTVAAVIIALQKFFNTSVRVCPKSLQFYFCNFIERFRVIFKTKIISYFCSATKFLETTLDIWDALVAPLPNEEPHGRISPHGHLLYGVTLAIIT